MKKILLILTILLAGCDHCFNAEICDQDGCKTLQHRLTKQECDRFIERMESIKDQKKFLMCRDVGP